MSHREPDLLDVSIDNHKPTPAELAVTSRWRDAERKATTFLRQVADEWRRASVLHAPIVTVHEAAGIIRGKERECESMTLTQPEKHVTVEDVDQELACLDQQYKAERAQLTAAYQQRRKTLRALRAVLEAEKDEGAA